MTELGVVLITSANLKIVIERCFVRSLTPIEPQDMPCYWLDELLPIFVEAKKPTLPTQYLILKNLQTEFAVGINAKTDLIRIDSQSIYPLPLLVRKSNPLVCIRALAQINGEMISIVDPRYFKESRTLS